MPTVHRFRGYRFVIWPNDHPPPHVHVRGANASARVRLVSPARLEEAFGISRADAAAIEREVTNHFDALLREWRRIHG